MEADPTLVAVCGAIGAADWLQVPWAGHPEGPILADAAGILAAINLGKQHNIGPKVSSCPERTNHTQLPTPRSSARSSSREETQRYHFESAQAVRSRETSLQKFLITPSCWGPGEARHGGRIAVGETVPNEGI